MTGKNRIIGIVLLAVMALAVLCTSGVTLALNLTSNRNTGVLRTAGIDLTATVKSLVAYVAKPTSEGGSDTFTDNEGNYYKYVQCAQNSSGDYVFDDRGGKVSLYADDKGQNVTIENMMPGDKVEFDIEVQSDSSVAFDYRAELYVDASKGQNLLKQLDFQAGELGLWHNSVSVGDEGAVEDELKPAVLTDYTSWSKIGASTTNIETIRVSVALPIDAAEGQNEKIQLHCVVSGVNSTATSNDVASFVDLLGQTRYYTGIAEAVEEALAANVHTVNVIGSSLYEEGTIRIDRELKFVGVANGQGEYPTLNGARVIVENGAAATFTNVNFDGVSYIDVTEAYGLTMENCNVNVKNALYYDNSAHTRLDDGAFVVSGYSLTPVSLTMTDNVIISSNGGAAINLNSPLRNGSSIARNVFGADGRLYDGKAVMMFNGAANWDEFETASVITVSDNALYGSRALSLGSNAGINPYLVYSLNNSAYGIIDSEFVCGVKSSSGNAYAAFVDNGSKIGSAALGCANIAGDSLMFGGTDVTLSNLNLIASGKISVNIGMADFYANYTTGVILQDRAIQLYRGGVHYGYLNSDGSVTELD